LVFFLRTPWSPPGEVSIVAHARGDVGAASIASLFCVNSQLVYTFSPGNHPHAVSHRREVWPRGGRMSPNRPMYLDLRPTLRYRAEPALRNPSPPCCGDIRASLRTFDL
jgi:hypothetical protein